MLIHSSLFSIWIINIIESVLVLNIAKILFTEYWINCFIISSFSVGNRNGYISKIKKVSESWKAHLEIIDGKFCIDIDNYITTESIILQISIV